MLLFVSLGFKSANTLHSLSLSHFLLILLVFLVYTLHAIYVFLFVLGRLKTFCCAFSLISLVMCGWCIAFTWQGVSFYCCLRWSMAEPFRSLLFRPLSELLWLAMSVRGQSGGLHIKQLFASSARWQPNHTYSPQPCLLSEFSGHNTFHQNSK